MRKLHTHQMKAFYLMPFKYLCASMFFLLFSSHLFAADILMGQYDFTTPNQLKPSNVTQGITMGDIQIGGTTPITVNYTGDAVETANWHTSMSIGTGRCINLSITKGSNASEFNVNKIIITLKRTAGNKIQINYGNEANTFDYKTYTATTLHGSTTYSNITLTENNSSGGGATPVSAIPAVTDGTTQYLAIGTMSPSAADIVTFDKIEVWGTVTTTPAAPTITSITANDTQLSVAFTAGSDGNSAITNYEYSTDGGSSWTTRSPVATTSPIVISGLTNSTAYNVQLRAVNAVGLGTATATTVGTTYLFYEDFANYDATATTSTTLATLPVMPNNVSLSRVSGWTGTFLYQYKAGSPNLGTVCLGSTATDSAYITTPAMDLSQPFTVTFKARSLTTGTDGRFNVYLDGTQLIYSGIDNDIALTQYITPAFVGTATSKLTFTGRKMVGNEIIIDGIIVNSTSCSSCDLTLTKDATLTISENKTYTNLSLAPGAKLTLGAGTLTVSNGLTLESDANGTATILQSGTLIGNVIAKQYLGSARNWYVSSPVSSAGAPATNVDYYYEYVEGGNNNDFATQPGSSSLYWKGIPNGTTMEVGKGYIAKTTVGTTVQFSGTPNNGDITTTFNLTRNDSRGKGFNLVGNPYPSYLDWVDVAAANTNLDNTYYYRTKNSLSGYTFVTWNGAGSSYVVSNGSLPVNTTVTRFIPPTQAFWVRVKSGTSSTSMNFTNAMREHRDDNGNLMKAKRQDTRTSVRLQLQNGTETDELLIYQDDAASYSFDAFDSPKMMNNSSTVPDLYSKVGDERLVINGLNIIGDNTELPLGFSLNAAASLKLKATELNNLPEGTKLYLRDKLENSETEMLPTTEYTFNTTASTTNNESRFTLLFKAPGITTGTTNVEKEQISVFVNTANQITIIASEKSNYSIYNAVGQIVENGILKNTKHETRNTKFATGVYVVKVGNQSNRVIIK